MSSFKLNGMNIEYAVHDMHMEEISLTKKLMWRAF